ncbi:YggS family pyridoxal phosphate-dependent enzyme [Neobacillus sp. D3-1R]|uniref:YggS family pyridoxal phosphate-dependent enzyme n=1 Tax=Neobacillus sp. D3-1R TaxID=3445778 RepID=UPI003FA042E2
MKVVSNLEKISQEIQAACLRASRNPDEIKIIAVTKYVSTERAIEAIEAGITNLGENRDEGLLEKWKVIGDRPSWHYIGTLQSRKVKNIIDIVDYIHSLDRMSLAEEINKRANQPIKCFVQVNVSGEQTKHGLSPNEVLPFIENLKEFPHIIIDGLMTMAPNTDDDKIIRQCFQTLKLLQVQIGEKNWEHAPCKELSMGMSNDFKIAIEVGATMVRIGTALVGEKEEVQE